MTLAIEMKDVMKTFDKKTALRNVNIEVKQGEIFGFLGPSGSGKTTTVKILTSQLLHSVGTVRVLGADITELSSIDYKRMGILTDNSGLYERLSIYDNLLLFCDLYDCKRERIDEVLTQVNLIEDKKTQVKKLSKGMKQRVTLARAILHKPDILFLDEPTSALDPVNVQNIHHILKDLNKEGTTIFLTTHNMDEAETLCDRIAFLCGGEIVALDTPKNLRLQYAKDKIEVVLKDKKKETVQKDELGAKRISEWMKNGELLSIHSYEPTLGEIFIEVTGRDLA
ncbi:ABC transporter ATP-binding protein [Bacillus cytotoxicus]|uniref:ABC transporter ATP-binding protein n=1 Tax=Bacillus cytotoxicus TaxID=580165 RepID=UPI000863F555|nr:ABC transporter ATP-binding protein [Bacillus cytotoxicus]AWC30567.1 ABC transporter ATP-binding protein [Bacillus cytotoxicus]AWC42710.1 ABC transporter ATP-binding protein [Bacillus cytotoxicus]AWC50641.1 ABC transporter ATP-binding protein [Bacillus cytotoxicus]AWC54695.1 ABC transporter ATP-binding protein [Bacillus cytotoxicus]AWC58818.1 ABC transporter ATP-binding protein [Bacillus cytotoxicus]